MTTGYSAQVRYHPWVGDRYWEQEQRWLLLGESGYGLDSKGADALQQMIQAQNGVIIDPEQDAAYRLFAGAQRLMTGRDLLDSAGTKDFWRTVAFYHYVRDSMGSSMQRPTPRQMKESLPAFNEVVCQIRPHVVLVLGLKLWMALPGERDGWERGKERNIAMPVPRLASRKLSVWTGCAESAGVTHRFHCFPVMHPSSRGFAAGNWRNWMLAARRAIAASPPL
ncbi:MAG: hypothetical protein ACTHKH_04125 [Trinickia sp.]|jgi:hypothetical protein